MRTRIVAMLMIGIILASTAWSSTATDIQKATKNNKVVFLLVIDPGATDNKVVRDVVATTVKENKNTVMIEMDRTNPENADLVKEYRLSGAPLPLIMVIASNGAIAGAVKGLDATSISLQLLIPSPKKTEVIGALQSGKAVFIIAGNKSMVNYSKALSECQSAVGQMQNSASIVQVEFSDSAEAAFLKSLNVVPSLTEPVTLVLNARGQVTGSYPGAPTATNLVKSARTIPKSGGCCPSSGGGGGC